MDALQQSVHSVLTVNQDTVVYDDVPKDAVFPHITLGAFTWVPDKNKTVDWGRVSLQLHIWSEYSGKTEVNNIANDVTAVLTAWPLSMPGFSVSEQDIEMFEAFPNEGGGYHGIVTFTAKIQNTGGV